MPSGPVNPPAGPSVSHRAGAIPAPLRAEAARLWPLWLAWVLFVVYGSLVPLDFHPLPIDAAWQRLLQAPMLKLGVESRADWVANGVLYLPVGFLTTGLLMGRRAGAGRRLLAGALGLVFGCALAGAVEFAQTAFPPRSVSRNDLLAEAIGSALGMLGALAGADRFRLLLAGYGLGGRLLARRLAWFYALAFPALALFPFDLLLSTAEWQAKLGGGLVGWWLADSSRELGAVKLLAKLAVETLAVLPLGALWAAWQPGPAPGLQTHGQHPGLLRCALLGALLGGLIEALQLSMASGQSQGVSVLTRSLGFTLGALAWQRHPSMTAEGLRAQVRQWTTPILLALLPLLALYNGAWRGPWLAPGLALRRLQNDISFIPFFYHYYTTEMHAVISLVAVSLSYAPLGALGWAWHVRPGVVAMMALLLSLLMEASKLMAVGTHPDPSNLWIAAAAAWMTQALLQRLFLGGGASRHALPAPRR